MFKKSFLTFLFFFLFLLLTPYSLIHFRVYAYSETTYYIHQDNLGSVVAVTSAEQNSTSSAQMDYSSYGSSVGVDLLVDPPDGQTGRSVPTERAYTGQIKDTNTALQYYNARYYDPILSRFISADQMGGGNRYSYVGNNPILNSDPTGNIKTDEGGDGKKNSKNQEQKTITGCSTGIQVMTACWVNIGLDNASSGYYYNFAKMYYDINIMNKKIRELNMQISDINWGLRGMKAYSEGKRIPDSADFFNYFNYFDNYYINLDYKYGGGTEPVNTGDKSYLDAESVSTYLSDLGFNQKDQYRMLALAAGESGGLFEARNSQTGDAGLYQINPSWSAGPENNRRIRMHRSTSNIPYYRNPEDPSVAAFSDDLNVYSPNINILLGADLLSDAIHRPDPQAMSYGVNTAVYATYQSAPWGFVEDPVYSIVMKYFDMWTLRQTGM